MIVGEAPDQFHVTPAQGAREKSNSPQSNMGLHSQGKSVRRCEKSRSCRLQGKPNLSEKPVGVRHVLDDVYGFLAERLHCALQYGIARQRIVLDPGFGFGKTVQHNLDLLHGLEQFRALGQPLLVGTSRKSFLGCLLQRQVWDRLEGTLATVLYAVLRGAALVRVHDVAPVVQTVRLLAALEGRG